jgi:drug/metabolite transporter (DMT)-like permease
MTNFALTLVLGSAVLHAGWNLLAKRASGGVAFVWLISFISGVAYTPIALAVYINERPVIGLVEVLFIGGNAVLHIGYFLLLSRGYRVGDLSLVYPLARGTGPMLATLAAIILFGERPTPLAILGAVLIGVGVFIFTGGASALVDSGARIAIAYALLTGLIIATYTIWDKYAVDDLSIPPLVYDSAGNLGRITLLTLLLRGQWGDVRMEWRAHRWEAIGVGLLSPLAYIMILSALTISPVSYIAPAREISILIGSVMGTVLLAEGDAQRRWLAAGVMVLGVVALAFG